MTTVNTYLTFNGNCEEAFNFYKAAFGGDFAFIGKFKDMPQTDPNCKLEESELNKIMHIALPVGNTMLMGSDAGGEWAEGVKVGTNFSVSINTDSKDEADRLFNALSAGGKVLMPMNKTFWDSYFGMFSDKFNIQWMVSFDANPK
ncbi:MAG: VOC family protein [Bacteroidetes bacterium]|mgnify:CR=1 FL=1|jgi:PhnB protein|nr:VOC family protein [Bacteroidota bacterium]MBT6687631.1 VOC family protein [Bacteroidota bacterium]MBT7144780.1 VOC family protein [Bacteroidota bacterium]MBT7491407.1 VOC family protein [Bacteroidota bacterium]